MRCPAFDIDGEHQRCISYNKMHSKLEENTRTLCYLRIKSIERFLHWWWLVPKMHMIIPIHIFLAIFISSNNIYYILIHIDLLRQRQKKMISLNHQSSRNLRTHLLFKGFESAPALHSTHEFPRFPDKWETRVCSRCMKYFTCHVTRHVIWHFVRVILVLQSIAFESCVCTRVNDKFSLAVGVEIPLVVTLSLAV